MNRITQFEDVLGKTQALLQRKRKNMHKNLKQYRKKSKQVLIPNQLTADNIFALLFRNLLIINIFVLYLASLENNTFSFFVLFRSTFKISEL